MINDREKLIERILELEKIMKRKFITQVMTGRQFDFLTEQEQKEYNDLMKELYNVTRQSQLV